MTEAMGNIHSPKSPEAPRPKERLFDEELRNLLSAVGNHEAKAITLILMRNGNIYDKGTLYGEIINAQGENKGWIMNRSVPFNYCSYSLSPIGLVTKETFGRDLRTFGYTITPYGQKIAIPLAGLLLDFSERHNIPLNLLFGSTSSNSEEKTLQAEGEGLEFKKRAPSTTLKILSELLTSPSIPIREVDLGEKIGEHYTFDLTNHLNRLVKLSLIEYEATEVNKPFSSYRISPTVPDGELPILKGRRTLTKSIFDILKQNSDKYLTIEELYDLLPQEQKNKWQKKSSLEKRISAILFFLSKHKYADIKMFFQGKRSEIKINEEQRKTLTELLDIVFSFQNQDKEMVEKGRRLALEIIANPKRVSNLLKRAREASGFANRSLFKEMQENVLSIVLASSNGITNRGIQKLLEERYKKSLSVSGVNKYTSALSKQGFIKTVKEGNVKRFFLVNQSTADS